MTMDKSAVLKALAAEVAVELDAVERVAAMARDEASSEESKAEGKYDTRATEASYLARGQAWRVAELRRLSAWMQVFDATVPRDVVEVGALVDLGGHRDAWVFVGPIGGPKVQVDSRTLRMISLDSPLGGAMAGMSEGEGFAVDSPQGRVEYEILHLR